MPRPIFTLQAVKVNAGNEFEPLLQLTNVFVILASTTAREDGLLGKRAYKSSSPTGTCTPQNLTGESASISALLSAPFSCRDCSRRATVVATGKRAPTRGLSAATRFFHFMPNTSATHSSLEIFSYRFIVGILYAVYWHTLCLNKLPLLHLFDVFLAPKIRSLMRQMLIHYSPHHQRALHQNP